MHRQDFPLDWTHGWRSQIENRKTHRIDAKSLWNTPEPFDDIRLNRGWVVFGSLAAQHLRIWPARDRHSVTGTGTPNQPLTGGTYSINRSESLAMARSSGGLRTTWQRTEEHVCSPAASRRFLIKRVSLGSFRLHWLRLSLTLFAV